MVASIELQRAGPDKAIWRPPKPSTRIAIKAPYQAKRHATLHASNPHQLHLATPRATSYLLRNCIAVAREMTDLMTLLALDTLSGLRIWTIPRSMAGLHAVAALELFRTRSLAVAHTMSCLLAVHTLDFNSLVLDPISFAVLTDMPHLCS